MADEAKKKNLRGRRILAYVLAGVIILGAVLMFAFRDQIGTALGATTADASRGEAWIYEVGYSQVFAPAGNGLAVASSTGLQLLGPDGYTVVREIFPLDTPAIVATEKLAAAWDVGGTTLRVSDMSGKVTKLDTEDKLLSVTATDGGMLCVCTEATGYKGKVTVYDVSMTAVYEWYSGTGYLVTAALSPDGKSLAVLTVASDGGRVHTFALTSETERGSFTAPDELLVDLAWLSSSRICALSESRAVFLDGSAAQTASYDFGGMYLSARSFGGDGFVTLALSKYLSGGASAVVTVSDGGDELGRLEPESELKSLSADGRAVLCLWTDGAEVYSQSMSRSGNLKDVYGVRTAVLRKNGDVIAVLAGSARVYPL